MATTKATKTAATEKKATTTPVETKATVASTTEAKATAKKATKATTEAKATTKATTTKKTTAKTTTTAKNTSQKAVEPQVSYLLQFSGKEVNTTNILETVKTIWVEKFQGKLEDIKTIEIYLKPEEYKAYFVINGESNGDYFVEL